MSFNKTMKSRTDLHVVLSGSVFALFLPVMALSPNRALAGGLDISLNFEVAPPPPTETVVVEQGAPAQEVVVQGEPPPPDRGHCRSPISPACLGRRLLALDGKSLCVDRRALDAASGSRR